MKLRELLAAVDGIESVNVPDIDIQGLKTNSTNSQQSKYIL